MDKNNKMKKQEYFDIVRFINQQIKNVGFNYIRCFSDSRKKGTKYRTKLWGAGNSEQLVEYINKNFGTLVKAELLETQHLPFIVGRPSTRYYQGGVVYRPLTEIV